jgi:hypothetical protein
VVRTAIATGTLLFLLTGCMVLSRDVYFSPRSASEHELESPFPGSPFNQFTVFGAPADIITVEPGAGVDLGLTIRNSGSSSVWVGPVFVPMFPLHWFRDSPPPRSPLRLWFALVTERAVDFSFESLFVRVPDAGVDTRPRSAGQYSVSDRIHVPADGALVTILEFDLVPADEFDLHVREMASGRAPLPEVVVRFSRVQGWRVISLP